MEVGVKPEYVMTATVLNKLRYGQEIADKELATAIDNLEPIVDFLKSCGDMFYLPMIYLNGKLDQLKNFREYRKQK
jgi:hypothetical protein